MLVMTDGLLMYHESHAIWGRLSDSCDRIKQRLNVVSSQTSIIGRFAFERLRVRHSRATSDAIS